jgi:hypothetical protein
MVPIRCPRRWSSLRRTFRRCRGRVRTCRSRRWNKRLLVHRPGCRRSRLQRQIRYRATLHPPCPSPRHPHRSSRPRQRYRQPRSQRRQHCYCRLNPRSRPRLLGRPCRPRLRCHRHQLLLLSRRRHSSRAHRTQTLAPDLLQHPRLRTRCQDCRRRRQQQSEDTRTPPSAAFCDTITRLRHHRRRCYLERVAPFAEANPGARLASRRGQGRQQF